MRSSLSSVAHVMREPNAEAAKRACAEAYHKHGIICLRPEWLAGWGNQQMAMNLANELYGKRKA